MQENLLATPVKLKFSTVMMREKKKNQNFRRKLGKPITENSEIMGKTHSPQSKIEDYIFTYSIYKAKPKKQSHISSLCEYPSSRCGRRR